MGKITTGEYIRYKNGVIIKAIEEELGFYNIDLENNHIAKHSFNLIDLIQLGDYVNGELIDFVVKDKDGRTNFIIRDNILFFNKYNNITSIVTHEQFASVEYKVKEN